jgi:hypothetical protein
MKLRIKGNSLRWRLTRSEVSSLSKTGAVWESVSFAPGKQFVYRIEASEADDRVTAIFEDGTLVVSVPEKLVREWADSDQVSIAAMDLVPTILIEKDFACLEPRRGEDESDMFPNPGNTFCKSA